MELNNEIIKIIIELMANAYILNDIWTIILILISLSNSIINNFENIVAKTVPKSIPTMLIINPS